MQQFYQIVQPNQAINHLLLNPITQALKTPAKKYNIHNLNDQHGQIISNIKFTLYIKLL